MRFLWRFIRIHWNKFIDWFFALQGFGQAIVLENPAEYVANGAQWQFQLPESYDSQLVPAPDYKECVNCSTSQSSYWRRADSGHSLCHQCSYTRQVRPPKNPKTKPQAVSHMCNRYSIDSANFHLINRIHFSKPPIIDGPVWFVPIAKPVPQHCGDETIRGNRCAMPADFTTNCIT